MHELPDGLIKGTVTDRIDWTDTVFSLRVNAPINDYVAGQFTKLALQNEAGEWIRRAYSLVNSPNHKNGRQEMEFLLITDPDGELSPRLNALNRDDPIYVGRMASGFMTLNEIPDSMTDLWLLSTGTAIGPFLAILDELQTQSRFTNIVLVHAVRRADELVYQSKIQALKERYQGKLRYVPVLSRESCAGVLKGRIPQLLQSGELLRKAQIKLTAENSFFYLCGNPSMVRDTSEALVNMGYRKHLRRKSGHFSSENYW
ncbi:MAG: ferredoxin--NADP+ reductase [Psychromonas sp.]|jgi:ferredoxin--NADP+ reductase|uniref:ferredoxin--NADP reductase n=1 Tax=Psychromonas sp. TaxID=1884585 RepID=UPI0039E68E89